MISDEALSIAAEEYEQALLSSLPETSECDHSFSPRFEKKMRHLCHKAKYAPAYSALKHIACAVIAILLCGSMLLMLDADVRATAIGLAKRAYQSYNMYFFAGEAGEDPASQSYGFEKIPEGYTFVDRMDTDSGTTILYLDENGKYLDLSYEFNTDGNIFIFKAEDHIYTQEIVDGKLMDIYISKTPEYTSTIVWNMDEKVIFMISADCDKEGLIELAKKVCPID